MMSDFDNIDDSYNPADDEEPPSRSQIKRDMEALQELGKRITELRPDQQAQVPMDERLANAVAEMRRITANGAKKRHLQYIGKLMRTADADAIREAVERFDSASAAHNQHFHELEQWRERLIEGDNDAVAAYIEAYPQADIQHLRQLIRNAKKEREQNKPPATARKLFRYLREVSERD
jgi:ribosome-associated protein